MITAETVNGIVRFQASGLPVGSLYCRVDPGESQREMRARVDSLLDQIRPLARDRDVNHRHRLSVRADIKRIKDGMTSERWPPGTIAIFACSGRDLYEEIPLPRDELPEFLRLLPHDFRGRVAGTFSADPAASPVELAAAVIGTGGSARQIAADLMSEEHLAAAKLRFRPPPPDQGS